MEISVIIPTFKPDYYIWECLDSVKNQTLDEEKFEVLIILNGEKEPYYNNILNYIKENKLKNFKLLYTNQIGVSNARNIGLEICKGEYIAFIDDDDYIDKSYLENFYKILDKDTLFIANIINFNESDKSIIKSVQYKENDTSKNFISYRKSFSYIGAKIIPKTIIKDFRFNTKYKNNEDSLFMLEISINIKQVKTSIENSIYWRRVRKKSANFQKKSYSYIFKNYFLVFLEYVKISFKKGYNKTFIFIKILALLKGFFLQLINN